MGSVFPSDKPGTPLLADSHVAKNEQIDIEAVLNHQASNINDQKPKWKKTKFKLHIAIDFGTDGCALAFAYKDKNKKDKVKIYGKWRLQQINSGSPSGRTTKTKTQLILNKDNEVTCFGNAAKFTYFNLVQNEQRRMRFFERFKMRLYEKHLSRSNHIIKADINDDEKRDVINTAEYLYASNGEKVESKIVFIAVFQQLQQRAKSHIAEIKDLEEKIDDDDIQWILTVPAIWSEKAKNKMRDWIIEAGLVKKHISNQCVIVYEPDCASLSMQKQYLKDLRKRRNKHSKQSEANIIFNPCDDLDENVDDFKSDKKSAKFEKEDKYILIDAGGGTVDIACHKILDDGCVEEIVYPTGDKWGSCYIDDLFIKLLENIFNKEWIDLYKNKEPAGFVEVLVNFEKAKKSFYKHQNAKTHLIQLPDDFVTFLVEQCENKSTDLATTITQFGESKQLKYFRKLFSNKEEEEKSELDDEDNENDESVCSLKFVQIRIDDDELDKDDDDDESESDDDNAQYAEYIEMDTLIWKCLFDSKINSIIKHMEKLLEIDELKDCRFLGLVGGFSCSKYFQYRMQTTFGETGYYQMTIVIPKNPMLSVVEGAALMATTQFKYIRARKLKYTYGIGIVIRKESAKTRGITDDYINNKDNITTDGCIKGIFKVIAVKNERVSITDIKTAITYRRTNIAILPIFRSDKFNPKLQREGEKLATLEIHDSDYTDSKTETITEFHFYGTIFRVYAYPQSNPEAKQEVDIKYT